MKARRWGINKTWKRRLCELAECLARIPHKITLYGRLFKYKDVGRLLLWMFRTNLLFAIKRDAYIFKETGWFCRFPKPPQKPRQVGDGWRKAANFTLKPNTKASSLQFCETGIKTDIGGKKKEIRDGYMAYLSTEETSAITQNSSSREWVKDSFTRLIHSCQCYFIHISVCLYLQLPLDDINSVAWREFLEVRWQSLAKIFWFLCHCEIK